MKRSPLFDFVLALLAVVGTPLAALAQASAPPPSAGGAPSAAGSGNGVAMVLALIVLLALIVAVVKLYDMKRTRDDETLAIEARIADALLVHPSLSGSAVTVSVKMPLWGRSAPSLVIAGPVPSQELREAAIELATREVARHGSTVGGVEDRLSVDPRAGVRHVA